MGTYGHLIRVLNQLALSITTRNVHQSHDSQHAFATLRLVHSAITYNSGFGIYIVLVSGSFFFFPILTALDGAYQERQRCDLIGVLNILFLLISLIDSDSDLDVRLSTLLQTSIFKMGIRDLWTVSSNILES